MLYYHNKFMIEKDKLSNRATLNILKFRFFLFFSDETCVSDMILEIIASNESF